MSAPKRQSPPLPQPPPFFALTMPLTKSPTSRSGPAQGAVLVPACCQQLRLPPCPVPGATFLSPGPGQPEPPEPPCSVPPSSSHPPAQYRKRHAHTWLSPTEQPLRLSQRSWRKVVWESMSDCRLPTRGTPPSDWGRTEGRGCAAATRMRALLGMGAGALTPSSDRGCLSPITPGVPQGGAALPAGYPEG